jgi:NAD(P)-dependent dehydrogenase (short-subunit alcohol dehydrogenase family)
MTLIHITKHLGKIALVTGGSSGLGLATVQRLVSEGAFVYLTGRRAAELNSAAAQLGRMWNHSGDISSQGDLDRIFTGSGSVTGAGISCSQTREAARSARLVQLKRPSSTSTSGSM